jgi:DNA topoisomerase I
MRILTSSLAVKSSATISKSVDKAMDKEIPSNGHLGPGISIRNGPVGEMDVDAREPATNGVSNGKRKSRGSIRKAYKEATSSDEDDVPLVRWIHPCTTALPR